MAQDQLTYIAESVGEIKARVDDLYKELKGNGQPGFIAKTSDRLSALERQDHTRTWAGRVAYVVFTTIVTLVVAFKDRIWHGAH